MTTAAKLAAALPKNPDAIGLTQTLLDRLFHSKIEGGDPDPFPIVGLLGVKEAKVTREGERVVVLEVLRLELVPGSDHGQIELILSDAFADRTGAQMLPFELSRDVKRAFGHVDDVDVIDQREAAEDEHLNDAERLRRHLERVHLRSDVGGMTAEELRIAHESDHEAMRVDSEANSAFDHDPTWLGWTRVDIEAAEAESDDPHAGETGVILMPLDNDEPTLFDDGQGNA